MILHPFTRNAVGSGFEARKHVIRRVCSSCHVSSTTRSRSLRLQLRTHHHSNNNVQAHTCFLLKKALVATERRAACLEATGATAKEVIVRGRDRGTRRKDGELEKAKGSREWCRFEAPMAYVPGRTSETAWPRPQTCGQPAARALWPASLRTS